MGSGSSAASIPWTLAGIIVVANGCQRAYSVQNGSIEALTVATALIWRKSR
ncbi:hypothetical protein [Paenibacillus ferrarius]|uniref:hypothetical protein n=1 Tax=Paenibacillus ferrarius TaxID=1469647 RepID=UPI003D2CFB16